MNFSNISTWFQMNKRKKLRSRTRKFNHFSITMIWIFYFLLRPLHSEQLEALLTCHCHHHPTTIPLPKQNKTKQNKKNIENTQNVAYLIWNSKILNSVSSNITFWHFPKSILILQPSYTKHTSNLNLDKEKAIIITMYINVDYFTEIEIHSSITIQ